LNERAKFLAISYDKCPYCERTFRKKKQQFVDEKIMKKLLDSWVNKENS